MTTIISSQPTTTTVRLEFHPNPRTILKSKQTDKQTTKETKEQPDFFPQPPPRLPKRTDGYIFPPTNRREVKKIKNSLLLPR